MSTNLGKSIFTNPEPVAADAVIIPRGIYNLLMGLCLFWGFAVNTFMCVFFGAQVTEWAMTGYNMGILAVGYLVVAIIGITINTRSSVPIVSFIGYNLVVVPMGLILCPLLSYYDIASIQYAFGVTAFLTLVMMGLSYIFPQFFAKIGGALLIALIACIIGEVVCIFLFPGVLGIWDWIIAGLFCLYIGYDWYRAQTIPATVDNAIDAACALYIDIINLFIRVLEIVGKKN